MITFEEYLKGVSNNSNPIIEEEQEFLEEAYSPEMKQLISKEELSKIGNFINKYFGISVQNTDFHSLQNISTQNMKDYQYAIVVMNSGLVSIVKKVGNSLGYMYPQNYGTLTAKDVKNIKAAFVFNWKGYHNDTSAIHKQRQQAKPDKDILVQKSELIHKIIDHSKNEVHKKLSALCVKYKIITKHAYSEENGRWSIRVEKPSNLGSITLNYSTIYSKTPSVEISVGSKVITSITDFKDFGEHIADFCNFLEELEKMSPTFKELSTR